MNRKLQLATMTIALVPEMTILSSAQSSRMPQKVCISSQRTTDRPGVVRIQRLSLQLGLTNEQTMTLQPILRSEQQQTPSGNHCGWCVAECNRKCRRLRKESRRYLNCGLAAMSKLPNAVPSEAMMRCTMRLPCHNLLNNG